MALLGCMVVAIVSRQPCTEASSLSPVPKSWAWRRCSALQQHSNNNSTQWCTARQHQQRGSTWRQRQRPHSVAKCAPDVCHGGNELLQVRHLLDKEVAVCASAAASATCIPPTGGWTVARSLSEAGVSSNIYSV